MRLWARADGHMSLPSYGASPCVRARRGRILMNQLCERAHPKPVTTLVLYRCSVGLSTLRWSCNPCLVPLLSAVGTALLSAWLPAARTKNRHRSCCVCRALPAVMPATLAHTRERLLEQRNLFNLPCQHCSWKLRRSRNRRASLVRAKTRRKHVLQVSARWPCWRGTGGSVRYRCTRWTAGEA